MCLFFFDGGVVMPGVSDVLCCVCVCFFFFVLCDFGVCPFYFLFYHVYDGFGCKSLCFFMPACGFFFFF